MLFIFYFYFFNSCAGDETELEANHESAAVVLLGLALPDPRGYDKQLSMQVSFLNYIYCSNWRRGGGTCCWQSKVI